MSNTATKKGPGRVHTSNLSVRKDKLHFRKGHTVKFTKFLRKAFAKTLTVRHP